MQLQSTQFNQNQRNTQNLRSLNRDLTRTPHLISQRITIHHHKTIPDATMGNSDDQTTISAPNFGTLTPHFKTTDNFQILRTERGNSDTTLDSNRTSDCRNPRPKNQTLRTTLVTEQRTKRQHTTLNAILYQIQLQLKERTRKTNAPVFALSQEMVEKASAQHFEISPNYGPYRSPDDHFSNKNPPHHPIPRDFYNSAQMRGRFRIQFPS